MIDTRSSEEEGNFRSRVRKKFGILDRVIIITITTTMENC